MNADLVPIEHMMLDLYIFKLAERLLFLRIPNDMAVGVVLTVWRFQPGIGNSEVHCDIVNGPINK